MPMRLKNGAIDGLEMSVLVWKRETKFANWIAGLNGQKGPIVGLEWGLDDQNVLARDLGMLAGTAGS